ncbi:MAG: tRNA (guanosine(46)-N7)-methyltransferase TrmB [Candidatus Latescibacterota bacterium]|nr:tRNA (guanosine(46)-N7)-methyltransferase TrmB [Candidatus Latescibacterota bacterium]
MTLDEEGDADPVLDLPELFGDSHPVEVEIGIGKGRFLLDAAERLPEVNFIGVEYAAKYLRLAHGRALRRGLTNIRFVHSDAREFLEFFLATGSVQIIHLYFPDPWPKKRHHKRRIINAEFFREVIRILVPGGRLRLATDHDDYLEAMVEMLAEFPDDLVPVKGVWEGAHTNYEEKFLARGQQIHRRIFATPS